MPRVSLSVERLAAFLVREGYVFITTSQLSRLLGVSTRTAGRLLAEMERKGVATRWSKRAYKLRLLDPLPV